MELDLLILVGVSVICQLCALATFLPILRGPVFFYPPDFLLYPFSFFGLVFNRLAMFAMLQSLVQIQIALEENRTLRPTDRRLTRFKGFFPLAVFVPPGDLIAVMALILFIRCHTDHLKARQHTVADWAELGIGFGCTLQFCGVLFLALHFGSRWFVAIPVVTIQSALATADYLLLLGAVISFIAMRSLRRELAGIVPLTHWEVDPTHEFLGQLSQCRDTEQPDPTSEGDSPLSDSDSRE